MCNLYTAKRSAAEVIDLFRATVPANFNSGPGNVYLGSPGIVVRH